MNDKNLTLFKVIAVGAIVLYLYKLKQAQGTLSGINMNPEKIAGLASKLVPPEYRHHAQQIGSAFIRRMM